MNEYRKGVGGGFIYLPLVGWPGKAIFEQNEDLKEMKDV